MTQPSPDQARGQQQQRSLFAPHDNEICSFFMTATCRHGLADEITQEGRELRETRRKTGSFFALAPAGVESPKPLRMRFSLVHLDR